ncbi:hypothetical protein B0J17DRAFT_719589 [Rhizoctonia solani]|nr:hypothetical protein B0J17DRAFT_719589 [Rhizoctonia solani]
MVQITFAALAVVIGAFAQTAFAAPPEKRAASCSFPNPSSSSNVVFPSARRIKASEPFDGKNLRYSRRYNVLLRHEKPNNYGEKETPPHARRL